MKNFVSVSTNAARYQGISLNPQKLAGMCAKLKCCMNYEIDDYVEANRKMPAKDAVLQTKDNDYYQFKTDVLAGLITYSTDKNLAANLETISAERAHAIIEMNKQGEKPLSLLEDGTAKVEKKSLDLLEDADISRFDRSKRKRKGGNKPKGNGSQKQQQGGKQQQGQEPKQGDAQNQNRDEHNKGREGQNQNRDGQKQGRDGQKRNRQDNRRQQGQRRQGNRDRQQNAPKNNKEE